MRRQKERGFLSSALPFPLFPEFEIVLADPSDPPHDFREQEGEDGGQDHAQHGDPRPDARAGAGGGGGWRGGEAGSIDMEGYGGINGYNSSYFSSTNESDGVNSPSGRDAEGYARIDFE